MVEEKAYQEAVESGQYRKPPGLKGKYDNVRCYWEDDIMRHFLRPYVKNLVAEKGKRLERIRILDLGCGSGDGVELLLSIPEKEPDLTAAEIAIISPQNLGLYKGIDFSPALLRQAKAVHGRRKKVVFRQGDFNKDGLPVKKDPPYDLYYTSYGTLSHCSDEQLERLLSDIAVHAKNGALIFSDWIGRYSYEWQSLWTHNLDKTKTIDYKVSYIYSEEELKKRKPEELESLNLRLMSKGEVLKIVENVSRRANVKIVPLSFQDRSLLVGRHIDTGLYNNNPCLLRQMVNSLHEENVRTSLESLLFDYAPKEGFNFLNNFFENLGMCWNRLIEFANESMDYADHYSEPLGESAILPSYPDYLKRAMKTIVRIVNGVGRIRMGDPRANFLEPQLGYALRDLEISLQKGEGMGHGLMGIFRIEK